MIFSKYWLLIFLPFLLKLNWMSCCQKPCFPINCIEPIFMFSPNFSVWSSALKLIIDEANVFLRFHWLKFKSMYTSSIHWLEFLTMKSQENIYILIFFCSELNTPNSSLNWIIGLKYNLSIIKGVCFFLEHRSIVKKTKQKLLFMMSGYEITIKPF